MNISGNTRKQHYSMVLSRYTSFLNEIIGKTDTKKEGEGGGGTKVPSRNYFYTGSASFW